MSAEQPLSTNEWHWLWEAYIVGLCSAAIAGVVLLNHRFAGNVAVAAAALAGIMLCVVTLGRRLIRAGERDWRSYAFVGTVAALWLIALCASPAAVAALPALYPLAFITLSLPTALVVTTVLNLTPLALALLTEGPHASDLRLAVAITLVGVVASPVIGTVVVTTIRQRARLAALVAELAHSRDETARLSQQAGAAAERERLARDIHDTLAQGFTSIVASAQAVEAVLDTNPKEAKRRVALICETARENLAEARVMVAGLSPPALGDNSLANAIARQAQRLAAQTGIAVTVAADPDLPALGMATDVVLLRGTQEALANVGKHANASAVRIELGAIDGYVRLTVADNGVGLAGPYSEGFGLRGMRARAEQVGGHMSVSMTPGSGLTVQIEVPA